MLANLVNGKTESVIPVSDRAFQYGDGVFETLRVVNRRLTLWPRHRERLLGGCTYLGIPLILEQLENDLERLLLDNPADGIIKILVSRGSGGRGYQPSAECETLRVVQFHSMPTAYSNYYRQGVNAVVCDHPLSSNSRLSRFKHLCRLDQVVASRELGERFVEGIMLTDSGQVIEGTRSNLFLVRENCLVTPCLQEAGVQGVMRQYLLERFESSGSPAEICRLEQQALADVSEVFFCNSVFGVWPVTELQTAERTINFPIGPFTRLASRFVDEAFSFQG